MNQEILSHIIAELPRSIKHRIAVNYKIPETNTNTEYRYFGPINIKVWMAGTLDDKELPKPLHILNSHIRFNDKIYQYSNPEFLTQLKADVQEYIMTWFYSFSQVCPGHFEFLFEP